MYAVRGLILRICAPGITTTFQKARKLVADKLISYTMNTINPNAIGQRSKDTTRPWKWSIAMYAGESPLRLRPAPGASNPVLSAADVTDAPARFVADPFMVKVDGL